MHVFFQGQYKFLTLPGADLPDFLVKKKLLTRFDKQDVPKLVEVVGSFFQGAKQTDVDELKTAGIRVFEHSIDCTTEPQALVVPPGFWVISRALNDTYGTCVQKCFLSKGPNTEADFDSVCPSANANRSEVLKLLAT